MRQVVRNNSDFVPYLVVDDDRTRRVSAVIFPHRTRFDTGILLPQKTLTATSASSTSVIFQPELNAGIIGLKLSQFIGTGVTSAYCILPDTAPEGTYLIISDDDGVGSIIPTSILTTTAYQTLLTATPDSAKISGNDYLTMTSAFANVTLVYVGDAWRRVSDSSAAKSLIVPLLNLSVICEVDSAQDILIGSTYFDNPTLTSKGASSYTLKVIMSKTGHVSCPSGLLRVGLRDTNGIVTTVGTYITSSIIETSSATLSYLTANLTSTLSAATTGGILEAYVIRDNACSGGQVNGRIDSLILEIGF